MKRYVGRGEMFPRGYGFAYCDYQSAQYVAYPFPINWIVRYARLMWAWIRHPKLHDFEREYLSYSAQMTELKDKRQKVLEDRITEINRLMELMNRPSIDS